MGRIVVLLAIALAVGNAYCFERCLIDSPQLGAPPCHQHQDKPNASHCAEPHDLNIAPVAPVAVAFVPEIESTACLIVSPLAPTDRVESPPPLDLALTNLPLRI